MKEQRLELQKLRRDMYKLRRKEYKLTGRNPNSTLEEKLEEKSNYLEKVRSMREEIERQNLA